MQSTATSVEEYIESLPDERQQPIKKLRQVLKKNLPRGFKEVMSSGMIVFVVPHSTYPDGYHCDPSQPLPFIGLASQKHFIALYHMGIYGDQKLLNWFTTEYPMHTKAKLDMGKSCIRFKKPEQIPYELIAELAKKLTPADWIAIYESQLKK